MEHFLLKWDLMKKKTLDWVLGLKKYHNVKIWKLSKYCLAEKRKWGYMLGKYKNKIR